MHADILRAALSSADAGSGSGCASDYRSRTKLCACLLGIRVLVWTFGKKGNYKILAKLKAKLVGAAYSTFTMAHHQRDG